MDVVQFSQLCGRPVYDSDFEFGYDYDSDAVDVRGVSYLCVRCRCCLHDVGVASWLCLN